MKNLSLTLIERLTAISIFNDPKNKVSITDLKVFLEDVDKFRISDEDKEKAEWKDTITPDGKTISKFDTEKIGEKLIDISDFTSKFLLDKLNSMEISASDYFARAAVSLLEKLENKE